MADKKYVGNGKEVPGHDMVNLSICVDDIMPHFFEYKGKQYFKVTVGRKREVDSYGKTHSVWVDEFKPDPSKAQDKPEESQEYLNNVQTTVSPSDDIDPDSIPF